MDDRAEFERLLLQVEAEKNAVQAQLYEAQQSLARLTRAAAGLRALLDSPTEVPGEH